MPARPLRSAKERNSEAHWGRRRGAAASTSGGRCDLVSQGPICVEGGKKVLSADACPAASSPTSPSMMRARPPGTWLETIPAADRSPLPNPTCPTHHPPAPFPLAERSTMRRGARIRSRCRGRGHAARYRAEDYGGAAAKASVAWLVLVINGLQQDSTGEWRTILHRGRDKCMSLFL